MPVLGHGHRESCRIFDIFEVRGPDLMRAKIVSGISELNRYRYCGHSVFRKDFSLAPFGLSYIRPVFDPELRPKGAHVEGRVEDRPGLLGG
jgi:hypothetical protein